MAELKYEITREIGSIGESARGWSKELNMVSWNDREAKYDLREWSPDHSRMGKGVTMTLDELIMLKKLLNAMDELNVEISDSFDSDEFDV
ncbi:MAG: PC4/YdbC family ssDNA-binding protein [Oscillospiraceae bacterium]